MREEDVRGGLGQAPDMVGGAGDPTVLVVGGGVSGCACAAVMAAGGIRVTIVNGALDTVGLPGFGPDVCVGRDAVSRVMSVLEELPGPLRDVWVDACLVPCGDEECVVVDRRRLSVETKRTLERASGLHFRQGLVVDLEIGEGVAGGHGRVPGCGGESSLGRVRALTAFGEVLEADAVVLAPGLGLGGTVTVGDQQMPGGRYGETPSDGLRESLARAGAQWTVVSHEVGPRYSATAGRPRADEGAGIAAAENVSGGQGLLVMASRPLRSVIEERVRGVCRREEPEPESREVFAGLWNPEAPPSPYWTLIGEVGAFERERSQVLCGGDERWRVYPDGRATGEVHVAPAYAASSEWDGRMATRRAHSVRGLAIMNADARGWLTLGAGGPGGVWITGRAAGTADYLGSLISGVRVGGAIVLALAGSGCARRGTVVEPSEPRT